jgi:hypothetical protein
MYDTPYIQTAFSATQLQPVEKNTKNARVCAVPHL